MSSVQNPHDYIRLWDVLDWTPPFLEELALKKSMTWPGIPHNPISPNPISININNYRPPVIPISSLGERKTRRDNGYVSLSNYNNLP